MVEADLGQSSPARDRRREPANGSASRTQEESRPGEGSLTDFQIGMIGGGLLGLAAGMMTAALMALSSQGTAGSPAR